MRQYIVQPGDSPARIAAHFAGCPKCAADLVAANPRKPAVRYPNGFVTFQSLKPREVLYLPDKWFNGALDRLPAGYFAGLPATDGRIGQENPELQRRHHAPASFVRETAFGPLTVPQRTRAAHGLRGPPIPHCHAFTLNLFPIESVAQTWAAALQSALAANGFTNVLVGPPGQDGSYTVGGIWEGAAPLDTTPREISDGQGNDFQLRTATDNGPANPQNGPCSAHITPQIIQVQHPQPPQYNQPQGHTPQQAGQQQPQQGGGAQQTTGMSTGEKWGIGLALAAAAGGGVYLATRKSRRRRRR